MLETILGCLKWAAVGFVVAFALMKLFEASHIHDDIPKPAFKIRQTPNPSASWKHRRPSEAGMLHFRNHPGHVVLI